MTTPSPLTCPVFAEQSNIQHGFFTRQGGVSEGIYQSLNMGLGSSDNREHVIENRRRAMAVFGRNTQDLCTVFQTHSKNVEIVGADWDNAVKKEADAMVTAIPGKMLGISTADCVPVLFADDQAKIVGGAHAGWKGAIQDIMQETVLAMEKLGAERGNIRAVIGACIHQASYEVGEEFYQKFLEESQANTRFFKPATAAGKYWFDLPGFVESKLQALNLRSVTNLKRDTYADEALFFSFRRTTHRSEPDYGRLMAVVGIKG